jgi:hypothetical protein
MKSEGQINIADNYLKKESIIRHFAIALWANDAFLAQYALFQLDRMYESLTFEYQSKNKKIESTDSIEINYSRNYPKYKFQEIWAFSKLPRFELKKAAPSDQPEVFIAIKYPKTK